MTRFELGASVLLWRAGEVLVMKRGEGGFAAGGWFVPGGHVEPGETPAEACARELLEEAGIGVDPSQLELAEVMTYESGGTTAYVIVYNASCPQAAEVAINDEHTFFRWMTPEAYMTRFLDPELLRTRGLDDGALRLAAEVARVVGSAAAKYGGATTPR